MELKLIVVSGKANKGAVTLRPPIVIGRSRQAELTVAHPMISRRHCEIFEVDGLMMIRDLGSLNGTVVEGQRIEEAPLCPGNEFSLGPLTFRAEYEYEGDLDSLPAPKIVGENPSRPQAKSDSEASSNQAVDETPYFPRAEGPETGPPPGLNEWEQTATEAVARPQREEGVVQIDEVTEVKDDQRPEPTPPPPPRLQQQTVEDAAKPGPAAADDGLDDFLEGLDQ